MIESREPSPPSKHPFTQGVGTVHQFVGVILFVISMFTCCCTGFFGKETGAANKLTTIGWHRSGDPVDRPTYSVQRALTVTLPMSVTYGLALAAIGLGLQAENKSATTLAVVTNAMGFLFWIFQLIFFVSMFRIVLALLCLVLTLVATGLLMLSVGGWKEMRSIKESNHAN
jgi:hypothetical protein